MTLPNPNKTREWLDGNTPATGTPALGSYFNAEFDQLYENDNAMEANKLDKAGGTITGNLTVSGDLTVNGDTVQVNTTELNVEDKVITLNDGEAGPGVTGDGISGIEVDRGIGEDKARLIFDESDDEFKAGLGTSVSPLMTMAAMEQRLALDFFNVFSRLRKNGSSNEILVPPFRVILDGEEYFTTSEETLGVADLDTGAAFVFGSDYYVWAGVPASGKTPVLKISLSATTPAGLTTPKIIGGFHYGKIRNSITISDVSDGLVPNSCWDLKHMPKCYLLGLADPSTYQIGGMVEVVTGSLWVDIYLVSDGGGGGFGRMGFSKINQLPLSGTDGLCWYDFAIRAKNVGKRMLNYSEWTQAAIGSPQGIDGSNANGWTKTSNTARVKTAATEAADADADYINAYNTSLLNVRDCVGNLWEWLADAAGQSNTGWVNSLDVGELSADTNFGQRYGVTICLLAGGSWNDGVYAGSRAVYAYRGPWNVLSTDGSRFACDSL
jgi:hypothetical protein